MHYTAQYNRGKLAVAHPQLEANINEQRAGRKRFDLHKNGESSGLSYGYGLNLPAKSQYESDPVPKPTAKSEPISDPYYKAQVRQIDYRNEGIYRDSGNYASKNPEPQDKYQQEVQAYKDYSYQKYPPMYEEPKYEDPYYQNPSYGNQNTSDPYSKYQESYQAKPNEASYQGYPEKDYGKIESQAEMYDKNPYSKSPQDPIYSKPPQEDYQKSPLRQQESYEEPKYPEYSDEIEKLKEELKKKEEELALYQQSLQEKPPVPMNPDEAAIYSRINKASFDKIRIEEQKKTTATSLEQQMTEKSKVKMMEQLTKEREQQIRLEMLKKIKEDDMRERYEKAMRAKEYREQLEVQSLVKSNISQQERNIYKNDIPRQSESPVRQVENISRNNSSVPFSPGTASFTKKTPKTICYNPITGVLKDTSQYVIGSYPGYNVKDPSITYLKNQSNVPELAVHPAFQQHKFTKHHPKVVPSYPITGNNGPNQEWKDAQEPDNFKPGEGRMAEYGSLMMQNRPPPQYI